MFVLSLKLKNMKHTKGKWKTQDSLCDNLIDVMSPFVKDTSHVIAEVQKYGFTKDEQRANAKLIAAAPDMIEFIETVYSQLGDAKQYRDLTVFETVLYNGAEKIVEKLK